MIKIQMNSVFLFSAAKRILQLNFNERKQLVLQFWLDIYLFIDFLIFLNPKQFIYKQATREFTEELPPSCKLERKYCKSNT